MFAQLLTEGLQVLPFHGGVGFTWIAAGIPRECLFSGRWIHKESDGESYFSYGSVLKRQLKGKRAASSECLMRGTFSLFQILHRKKESAQPPYVCRSLHASISPGDRLETQEKHSPRCPGPNFVSRGVLHRRRRWQFVELLVTQIAFRWYRPVLQVLGRAI